MRVVIVGAGISGLACALQLSKHNITEITILEGDSTIGGRIKTEKLASGQEVDLGASWFHAAEHNPLYTLSKQFDDVTTSEAGRGDQGFYFTNFSEEELKEFEEKGRRLGEGIFERFYDEVEALAESPGREDQSYAQLMRSLLLTSPPSLRLLSSELYYRLFHCDLERVARYEAGDVRDISAKYGEDKVAAKGSPDLFVSSFGLFLRRYRSLLPPHIRLHCNSPVTLIHQTPEGVVKLRVENGDEFECEKVVVTVPLGVLKSNAITFLPPLPLHKQIAIEQTGFGLLNKLFLEFEEPFWTHPRMCFINRPSDPPFDLHRDLDSFLSSSLSPLPDEEEPDEEAFIRDMKERLHLAGLSLLESLGKPILLFFIPLPYAERMERLPDSALIDIFVHRFVLAFPHLPRATLTPLSHVITRWRSNAFTRGSYTYQRVNCPGHYYDLLAEPFDHVHFAGEHTARGRIGYSQGAYLSGLREADLIARSLSP